VAGLNHDELLGQSITFADERCAGVPVPNERVRAIKTGGKASRVMPKNPVWLEQAALRLTSAARPEW
jgi:hypothetical protein